MPKAVLLDLGSEIGLEVQKNRRWIVYDGYLMHGRAEAIVIEVVETNFAIRDRRLRFGVSIEFLSGPHPGSGRSA